MGMEYMKDELGRLIEFIEVEYQMFCEKWKNSEGYLKINLKNNLVSDLLENEEIMNAIFSYREFINENNIQLIMDFKEFNTEKAKVNIRAKTRNSIEYKIRNYIQNHESGKVPIEKCLNDLLGIRIICKDKITYNEVKTLVATKDTKLKCIDSTKQDYKATHIYFKYDNYNFQWELQVWNQEDEINNINSHEKYKQDYVKWERENQGGKR